MTINVSSILGGSGSGGVSVPINGLLPLSIDPSTELFTTAGGEVFLKTGVLSTATTAYPDAYNYPYYVPTGSEIDTSAQTVTEAGCTFDGTNFWFIDSGAADNVHEFTPAGVYTGNSFNVAAEDLLPQDITWDGTHFWVLSAQTDTVYQYTDAGVYTGTSFSVNAQAASPSGLVWDGTHFWVSDPNAQEVFQYNASGTYTGTSFALTSSQARLAWDGSFFYSIDNTNDLIVQYTSAGATGFSFRFDAVPNLATLGAAAGICAENGSLWIQSSNGVAYQFVSSDVIGIFDVRTDTDTELPIFLRIG